MSSLLWSLVFFVLDVHAFVVVLNVLFVAHFLFHVVVSVVVVGGSSGCGRGSGFGLLFSSALVRSRVCMEELAGREIKDKGREIC